MLSKFATDDDMEFVWFIKFISGYTQYVFVNITTTQKTFNKNKNVIE